MEVYKVSLVEQFVYVTLYEKFGYCVFNSRQLNSAVSHLLRNYKFTKDEIVTALTKFIFDDALYRTRTNNSYIYRLSKSSQAEYVKIREEITKGTE